MRLGAGVIALVLITTACGSSGGHGSAAPSCRRPPTAIGPDATASLTDRDGLGPWCLRVGDVLTVYLSAPTQGEDRWEPVTVAPSGILVPRSTGVQTLVRGVTAGIFEADRPGTAHLRSARPGGPTWAADVQVERKQGSAP